MANQTEREFTATIISLLEGVSALTVEEMTDLDLVADEEEAECLQGMDVTSFKDGGVMTSNAGLTVRLQDGTEFQLTVVRSR